MEQQIEQSLYMRALKRQSVERTPVWLMRQAGRYLPEYRQVRQKAGDFMSLCRTPELACEVTLQPLRRFQLDAAILFSDILTIPDAMGLGLYFAEGEGPCFEKPLRSESDFAQIPNIDVGETLDYVIQAASLIRQNMPAHIPLIGFAGSPWTLACYMIEGHGSREFKQAVTLIYQRPELAHRLLEQLAKTTQDYLAAQIEAGVNSLMIFDTWGGLLTPQLYQTFSLAYMKKIVGGLKYSYPNIPITLFTKGGGQWLNEISSSGCDCVGLDWTVDIGKAKEQVGNQVALQGNLHPLVLLSNPQSIEQSCRQIIEAMADHPGHIFNLGHGITPDVPPEHVSVLIEAVKKYSLRV
ncbi:uroporphyrinogen decarboxylase [Legionella sp. W05-934-2]|jgi:uroporphyrinogen decarboxylase|uniref:uroporphyrinogen decarboxylase n=1 Tax=Legionella sp. W05-934-2 TaxID=1198649 RepID=UPI00346375BA